MAFTLAQRSQSTVHSPELQVDTFPVRKVFSTGSSLFVRRFCRALILLPQRTLILMRSLLVGFTLLVTAITVPMMSAQKVTLSIDASKTGAKIDRNIFGQFAEH